MGRFKLLVEQKSRREQEETLVQKVEKMAEREKKAVTITDKDPQIFRE